MMCEKDGLAIRRPARMLVIQWMIGQALQVTAICVNGIQFIVAITDRFEHDRFTIRSPIGAIVVRGVIRQVDRIRTVGMNDKYFIIAWKFLAEHDLGAIGRPIGRRAAFCARNFCQI